ncbi:MAG: Ig-like domain-containing protein [bacterium]
MLYSLLVAFFILLFAPRVSADHRYATESATIRATVPSNVGPIVGKDTIAPSIPILLRPVDGTYTNQSRPEFVWLQSKDENSNWVSYDLYLNHVATYLGVNNYGNSLTTYYTARLEDGSVRLLPLNNLQDGTYDWYVVAYDKSGNASTSASWHLVIDTVSPSLQLLSVGSHTLPDITSSPTLTIEGPGSIPFVTSSDPYAKVSIVIYNEALDTTLAQTESVGANGKLTLSFDLSAGIYQVFISAQDLAGNPSTLPTFYLNIQEPSIPGVVIPTLPPIISQLPSELLSLPATAMLVATRVGQSYPYVVLLAIALLLLLIPRRKHNVEVLDPYLLLPLANVQLITPTGDTYYTGDAGKCLIPNLTPHSDLIIHFPVRNFTNSEQQLVKYCPLQLQLSLIKPTRLTKLWISPYQPE